MRECVLAKLQAEVVGKSYYRAILDTELHLMAIAAELRHSELITKRKRRNATVIKEALAAARQVFMQRAVSDGKVDGGFNRAFGRTTRILLMRATKRPLGSSP